MVYQKVNQNPSNSMLLEATHIEFGILIIFTMKNKKVAHASNKKSVARKLRVLNLQSECGVDQAALCALAEILPPVSQAPLFNKVFGTLLGFNAYVQLTMVEALCMFYFGKAYTLTGLPQVDQALVNLYSDFARLVSNPLKSNKNERN